MRLVLFADIHIGSIKDTTYVYNVTTDIIEKEIIFKHTDVVVILGDYFHRLFKVNEEYVSLAINIMSYLIRACSRSNTKIRIVYGTESHEMNQYKLFNYHMTSNDVDIKVFTTATEETVDDKRVLYIPEEYIHDKHKSYKKYLYSDKKYDYIFGHGIIEDGMPSIISYSSNKSNEKQVPRFKSAELGSISKVCVFGHYHCYTDMGDNVYYLGSLFRDSFGEEEPKGYGIIEDDVFTFVENAEAYVYKTYEFNPSSDIYTNIENMINEVNRIKEENKSIIDGTRNGRIRFLFKPPSNIDPSFKENIRTMLFNDKHITPLIKESSDELTTEIEDNIDHEWDFIIDNSLNVTDKIHQFINKKYDYPISLETIETYIHDILKI